jgi:hypothetical protein
MIQGSCLCGAVTFQVLGEIIELGNCHCSQCRKAYGSAFGTVAVVQKDDLSYTGGEERVRRFVQTERVNRYFCDRCGSPLPMVEEWDPLVGIPAGLFDDEIAAHVSAHIFVGSKASWWEIWDDLPRHERYPPGEDMNDRAEVLRRQE